MAQSPQPVILEGNRAFLSWDTAPVADCSKWNRAEDEKIGCDGNYGGSMRMKTQFDSVAARDGSYGLDDGLLACVEISSGDRKWKRSPLRFRADAVG